jgi:Icc-related predicted phosphoesterase
MKIVIVSDTHNYLNQVSVPEGDVLIHAGDATGLGTIREIAVFKSHLERLPHRHKIFVPGNHDWLFERDPNMARAILEGVTVLIDQEVEIEGLKIYGSPWSPRFFNWAFNMDRGEAIGEKWKKIPDSLDILITHGPPYGILDLTYDSRHVGCEELAEALKSRVKCRLHVFGHIHHSYGVFTRENSYSVNASICDETYRVANRPVVFDVYSDVRGEIELRSVK